MCLWRCDQDLPWFTHQHHEARTELVCPTDTKCLCAMVKIWKKHLCKNGKEDSSTFDPIWIYDPTWSNWLLKRADLHKNTHHAAGLVQSRVQGNPLLVILPMGIFLGKSLIDDTLYMCSVWSCQCLTRVSFIMFYIVLLYFNSNPHWYPISIPFFHDSPNDL